MKDTIKMTRNKWIEHCNLNNVVIRSCWNCNSSHERLKDKDYIIHCIWCNRLYLKGKEIEIIEEVTMKQISESTLRRMTKPAMYKLVRKYEDKINKAISTIESFKNKPYGPYDSDDIIVSLESILKGEHHDPN